MGYTVVSFHAHPDDEALLTAGTLARAVDEGHRVVLVTATAGEFGLADEAPGPALKSRRLDELQHAAAAIGADRVECLGYADSGYRASARSRSAEGDRTFAECDVDAAAKRLAGLLCDEDADLLTIYDAAGGYGHPDHVQVHRVGLRAAELAGTQVVLAATVERERLLWAARLACRMPGIPRDFSPHRLARAYTPRGEITHRVPVGRYRRAKRAAMAAHVSQTGGDGPRTLAVFLRLPDPLFRLVFGVEYFAEIGRPPGTIVDDIFDSLRPVQQRMGRSSRCHRLVPFLR